MKGCYCLIINLSEDTEIEIGRVLGEISFKKGCYVYVGSAMNSLEGRVKRHLSDNKKKHWHIDYLLLNNNSKVEDVILNISNEKIECKLSKFISENETAVSKFGCSDCRCKSHLIYFDNSKTAIEKVKQAYEKLDINCMNLDEFKNLNNEKYQKNIHKELELTE